jgi:hypothetical protein
MRNLFSALFFCSAFTYAQEFSLIKGTLFDIHRNQVTLGFKTGFSYGLSLGESNMILLGPELNLLREQGSPILFPPTNETIYANKTLLNFPLFFAINTSSNPYTNIDFFMKYGAHFGAEISKCYSTSFIGSCILPPYNMQNNVRFSSAFSIGFETRYYFKNKSFVGLNFGGKLNTLWRRTNFNLYTTEKFYLEAGLRYGFNFLKKD